MSALLLRFAALLYAGAATAYLVSFLRARLARAAAAGDLLLLVGFALHTAAIGVGCAQFGGREIFSLRGGLSLIAWSGAGTCLLLQRFARMPQLGAFAMPLVGAALAPALIGDLARPELSATLLQAPLLHVHIMAATLGMALLGTVAGVSVMYLLQRRQLKRKRFGTLFSRLPPLEELGRLNERLLLAGFASYGVSAVTGTIAANAFWSSAWWWDPKQIVSALVLALYGAIAFAFRRGSNPARRATITVAAFALTVASTVGVRLVPGMTRHTGEYGTTASARP